MLLQSEHRSRATRDWQGVAIEKRKVAKRAVTTGRNVCMYVALARASYILVRSIWRVKQITSRAGSEIAGANSRGAT